MFGRQIFLATAIVGSLLCAASASAQQTGAPKAPPPSGTSPKSTHVSRDVCVTHPKLPQCS